MSSPNHPPNITCKPDENQSVADLDLSMSARYAPRSPTFETQANGGSAARVAILDNGYGFALAQLLSDLGIAADRVDPAFSPNMVDRYPVLMIPTGGLSGYVTSTLMRTRLAEYVDNGGTLIIMDQAYGEEFALLPGEGWQAYGFEEDFFCRYKSAGIATFNDIFASQRDVLLDLNVDGFFNGTPPGSTVLLHRTATGAPIMVLYEPEGSAGRIIATTAYADMATFMGQGTDDERVFLRDLVRWALVPGPIDHYGYGETISKTLTITNTTSITITRIGLGLLDPNLNMDHLYSSLTTVLAPGQSTTVPFTLTLDSALPAGLWTLRAWLAVDEHREIAHETDIYAFALRAFAEGQEGWTYQGKPHALSITSDAERYLWDSPAHFTFHIWNHTDSDAHYKLEWYEPHRFYRQAGIGSGSQEIDVPAGQEGTVHYTLPRVIRSPWGLGRVFASLWVQEGGS